LWCRAVAAVALALCWTGWAAAQTVPPPGKLPVPPAESAEKVPAAPGGAPIVDPQVVPAGCAGCSGGLLGAAGGHGGHNGVGCNNCPVTDIGCASCGTGCCSGCVPGRLNCCSDCEGKTCIGKMLCGLYCCICCPDPCYEPCYIPAANAAFFVDSARPVTQMRFRWDAGLDMTEVDRSEFFWARADGGGRGPKPPKGFLGEASLRYNDLDIYTETLIVPKLSLFFEMPYRNIDPQVDNHAANFGDLNIGTKTLLLDCDLLQITFQFRTFIPTGNFTHGIGTGHVSLEPSLLATLKLTPDTFLQTQLSEWIPLGGDVTYQGAVLHYHVAVDQVLWRILPDVPLIGTAEFNGYSFQDGAFTDPVLGPFQKSSGGAWLSAGPGLRLDVCKKIDFGVAAAFGIGHHGPEQLYRTEFRWRF
jgi:hypothetical protein